MREHGSGRLRRREDEPDETREYAAEPPSVAAVLALQRSAGNRALQRLIWNSTSGNLTVPADYASQRISWDGQYAAPEPGDDAKTFLEHVTKKPAFTEQVRAGLGVEQISLVKSFEKHEIENNIAGVVKDDLATSTVTGDQAVYAKMVHDAGEAATSHNRLLTLSNRRLANLEAIRAATRLVPRPSDYLPSKPDLPGMGAKLFTPIEEGKEKKHWEHVCVLIALYKAEGIDQVRTKTGEKALVDDVDPAVHALHDYYMGKRKGKLDPTAEVVQYDDTSARSKVMGEWGYSMIFAGESDWGKLPEQVELAPGTYIFDVKGHTVKVNVLKQVWRGATLDNLAEYFQPDSEGRNFTRGNEFKRKVISIWKKG